MTSAIYRADQVGSLLRPPALLEARRAVAEGRLDERELAAQEDRAILAALQRQREVGLPILTDGEFRRGSFITGLADAVDGFVPHARVLDWQGPGGGPEQSTSRVVGGRLRQRRRLSGHESSFLKKHAGGPFKVTVPAPSNFYLVSWQPGVSDRVYATRGEMLGDVTRILRAEVEALVAEGVDYVQLDAPFYGLFMDDRMRERLRADGVDPDRALAEVTAADAALVDGLRGKGTLLALHICRGNSRSRWLTQGGYDRIAEALFGSIGVDAFLLEYDSPRAGGFEPLRQAPAGATVVLGLVTTKEPTLESRDSLARRIGEASRFVPLERLALSPQCGFASVAAGNLLDPDDQWRKLELVVETARQIWGHV